ncbi:MAG: dihydroorotate dehydrogenase, partial [Oscillospiraceae bacterium]
IELNISCPNVKEGGVSFGTSANSVENITQQVKMRSSKPIMIKLTPNVTDIAEIAKAAESGGADAISLINTITAMKIDINTRRPILKNNTGGLSGRAVLPVAVRMVWQVAQAVGIPVVGMGGIATWQDAIEMMLAGACAIQVGTANFTDAYAPIKIIDGIEKYCNDNDIRD